MHDQRDDQTTVCAAMQQGEPVYSRFPALVAECSAKEKRSGVYSRSKGTREPLPARADRELTHPVECRRKTTLIRRAGQRLDDQGVVVAKEGLQICAGKQGELHCVSLHTSRIPKEPICNRERRAEHGNATADVGSSGEKGWASLACPFSPSAFFDDYHNVCSNA